MRFNWRGWINHRFALNEFRQNVLDRRVPKAPWYQGDGAALTLLLGVLVVTGMCMTPTYSPTPDTAYDSVEYITQQQLLGWFIRALHYWAAGLMVVMVLVHLLRQILVGGYKFPREGTWLIGVAMFFLVLTMGFTGYVLRWDERGLYALKVAMNMFWRIPWIGESLAVFIQGGRSIGAQTLTRVYAVHIVFVPMTLLALVGWHLYLVIVRGVTSNAERGVPIRSVQEHQDIYHQAEESEQQGETFHPQTSARSGAMAFAVFLLAIVLALWLGPQDLHPQANLVERAYPKEEWYFWWYSGLIALLPAWIAPWFVVLFPLAVLAILVALPFLDRGPYRGIRRRPVAVVSVVLIVAAMLYLTDLRRRSPWTAWPQSQPPPVPQGVSLSPQAEQGRQLFAMHGCTSCHAIAGSGPSFGPDLARIEHRLSLQELRAFILEPTHGAAMPDYQGRISQEDLDRIVDFVLVSQTWPDDQQYKQQPGDEEGGP